MTVRLLVNNQAAVNFEAVLASDVLLLTGNKMNIYLHSSRYLFFIDVMQSSIYIAPLQGIYSEVLSALAYDVKCRYERICSVSLQN